MSQLVLIRHGQSQWNLENRFTGWVDVDLSDKGEKEAHQAGVLLRQGGFFFDRAHTSVLKRAIRTLWIALEVMDRMWIPQTADWRLNERHYGALQGLNKAETAERHGAEQVHIWRRSYDVPPPAMNYDDPGHPRFDPRYQCVDPQNLPAAESLKDTLQRVLPYWESDLAPQVQKGQRLIVAAHGNSIRAILKHLLDVADDDIPGLEVPTGNPLVLDFDQHLTVTAARYLDPGQAGPLPL
jgi:2,3-bisphosphoglycerate-dependent phosphoglycerate mutase